MDRPEMTYLLAAALVIQLLNPSGAPAAIVRHAQNEVTRVYAGIDVSIEWTTDSSTAADRTSVVRLVLLPYETGDLRRTERQVMGAAIRTSEGNAVAYVFYRRVRAEAD